MEWGWFVWGGGGYGIERGLDGWGGREVVRGVAV